MISRRSGSVRAAASALALCVLAAGCAASREASSASSAAIAGGASSAREASSAAPSDADSLRRPGERHLRRIRQLTFGGENAEGYFSFDGERLAFQSTREPFACDQIFTMRLDGGDVQLMSTGRGRTTCSYFLPGNREVLYASTHEGGDDCPPRPDHSRGYVWALYDYDIFVARAGEAGGASPIVRRLTAHTGYDAEATVSPAGDRIVWTSLRDGDLDLYSMNIDGGDVRRLTRDLGYDGGAFFSPDGRRIVYRAHHPTSPDEIARYTELLAQNLVEPRALEIFVADADGANARAVTSNGAANFAPYWHPDGRRILFASNMGDARGRDFDVYMIRDDGTGLERVVADSTFDGFPVFSPDGKRLVFASNRASRVRGETNLFIADWVE